MKEKPSYFYCGFAFSEFTCQSMEFFPRGLCKHVKHSTGPQKASLDSVFLFLLMLSFLSKQTLSFLHTLPCRSGQTKLTHELPCNNRICVDDFRYLLPPQKSD